MHVCILRNRNASRKPRATEPHMFFMSATYRDFYLNIIKFDNVGSIADLVADIHLVNSLHKAIVVCRKGDVYFWQ